MIQGMTSFVNSTRYRLFEISPFIPGSYSDVVEAHSLSERMSRYTEYLIHVNYCKLFFKCIQKRVIWVLFITYLIRDLLLYFYHFLQVGRIHHEIRFFSGLSPYHVAPYSFQRLCFSQLFWYLCLLGYAPVEHSYNALLWIAKILQFLS